MDLIIILILLNSVFNVESSILDTDNIVSFGSRIASIIKNSEEFNDELCNLQIQYIIDSFSSSDVPLEPWIFSLIDSWGKMPSGITYGNTIELGNFDQCLQVSNIGSESISLIGHFKGQYCLLPISPNLSDLITVDSLNELQQPKAILVGGGSNASPLATGQLTLLNGMCVPNSCDPKYVFGILMTALSQSNANVIPMDPASLCINDQSADISGVDIVTIVLFAIVTCVMIASTTYDIYKSIHPIEGGKKIWCLSFSVKTNGKQLFACENPKSSDVITCLNGIRVISLVWVIYAHAYALNIGTPVVNLMYMFKWIQNIYSMILIDGTVSVDTFFVLSGLLVTWNILKEMRRNNGKLNVPLMYFHRFLRIISPLIMVILFQLLLFKHCGIGPFHNFFLTMTENCQKWWYTTLLFVQNYVNPNEMCLNHSWYLQVDMQLFILSPLIIIPLYRWQKMVFPAVCFLILLTIGCSFATFYLNAFKLSIFSGTTSMDKLYFPTHIRMGSWLVGVLLGCTLYNIKGKNIQLKAWLQIGGWIVSLGTMGAVIFGPYKLNQIGYTENLIESAMYTAFARVAWCLAVSWVIFACATGHGYFINSLLSMNIWLPFSRLSYSMYLLSFVIQTYRAKTTRVATYFSDYNTIYGFWGDFAFTFLISVYWVLAFEYPIAKLETHFLRNRHTKVKEEKPTNNDLPPN